MIFNKKLGERLNNCNIGDKVRFKPAVACRKEILEAIVNAGFEVKRISNTDFLATRKLATPFKLPGKEPLPGPESRPLATTHNRLQADFFQWVWNTYHQTRGCMFAALNELPPFPGETKKAHMIRVNQAKAIGLVPGVFDLIFYWQRTQYCFDVKVGKDRPSEAQLEFAKKCEMNGGECFYFGTLYEGQEIFKTIMSECWKPVFDEPANPFAKPVGYKR